MLIDTSRLQLGTKVFVLLTRENSDDYSYLFDTTKNDCSWYQGIYIGNHFTEGNHFYFEGYDINRSFNVSPELLYKKIPPNDDRTVVIHGDSYNGGKLLFPLVLKVSSSSSSSS